MSKTKVSLWNSQIVGHALIDSVRKLDPRWMIKNPVMFVVEAGSVLTSVLLVGVVLILGALTFFPALSLGPILEHLVLKAGQLF